MIAIWIVVTLLFLEDTLSRLLIFCELAGLGLDLVYLLLS